jgi:hypothetical protein
MAGAAEHHKDALEFLLHDMKHMEHFMDPTTHREQVGFCRAMLSLGEGRKLEVEYGKDGTEVRAEKSFLPPLHSPAEDHEWGQGINEGEERIVEQSSIQWDRDAPSELHVSSPSTPLYYSDPMTYFLRGCGFDRQLWEELEYVISDM